MEMGKTRDMWTASRNETTTSEFPKYYHISQNIISEMFTRVCMCVWVFFFFTNRCRCMFDRFSKAGAVTHDGLQKLPQEGQRTYPFSLVARIPAVAFPSRQTRQSLATRRSLRRCSLFTLECLWMHCATKIGKIHTNTYTRMETWFSFTLWRR